MFRIWIDKRFEVIAASPIESLFIERIETKTNNEENINTIDEEFALFSFSFFRNMKKSLIDLINE